MSQTKDQAQLWREYLAEVKAFQQAFAELKREVTRVEQRVDIQLRVPRKAS